MINFQEYIPQGSIYKYTSGAGALATLKNQSFRFSCPLDFNDPFDCNMSLLKFSRTQVALDMLAEQVNAKPWPRFQKRKYIRGLSTPAGFADFFERLIREKVKKSKVTCFSKNYTNTLMWSHYADQHRGICLEFNGSMLPGEIVSAERVTLLNVNYDRKGTIDFNDEQDWTNWREVSDLFTRKSPDWRYEEEVRLIVFEGTEFHQFSKPFLTGIILGCRTPSSDKKAIMDVIKRQNYAIRVRQAVRGLFDLKFEGVTL